MRTLFRGTLGWPAIARVGSGSVVEGVWREAHPSKVSSAVSVQTWTGTRPWVAATHSVKPTREGFSDLASATSRRVP
jgi:hypothetical protein